MMKRFFSVLLLVAALAAPAAAQRTLATRPHMPVADAKQATLHFQGLSSTSAFLLADLVSGDLDEDALVEKYGLVRSNGRLAVSAIATLQGGAEALKSYGVSLTAVYGESSSLLIPLEVFVAFAQSGLCSWLDVGAKARPALSNARSVLGIDAIHNGQYLPHGYDGTGVVVGIIDIGFEYGHPAFYSADGTTYRVKRVWDQNATSGTAPAGYNYGRELTTQSAILAARYSQTDETHGTHVAGIAAGCGGSTTQTAAYRGIAPGADIVLVATTMNNSGVLDGINYIRSYAASQQKPCVINMSIGSHVGPHDGTSAFDRACDEYLTSRPDSLILVGSAGNEGGDNLHVSKLFPGTDSLLYTFIDFVDPASGQCVIDIWGAPNVPFQAGLAVVNTTTGEFADAGNFYVSSSSYYESESQFNNMLQMQVYASGTYAYNQRQNLTMSIAYAYAADTTYRVCLVIECDQPATVHAWGNNATFVNSGFNVVQAGNTDYTVGELGGTGHHMISVGAYTTSSQWTAISGTTYTGTGAIEGNLANFSSHGPLLDGRTKPDITAPGQYIAAPFNRFNTAMTGSAYCVASTSFGGNNEYYGVMQGTSMASPMVAGVMALWLQQNPALGPDSALAMLRRTAIVDGATGTIPASGSNLWGWGKVNALGGLNSSAPVTYTLTVATNNEAYGTVSGSGTYTVGSMVTIEAIPATGYYFTQWNDGVSRNPRSIMVTQDTSFTAFFAPNQYTLTVVAGEHGTATGSGTYNYGDTIMIQAFPEEHYLFFGWGDGVTENPRSITLTQDTVFTAFFAPIHYTLTVAADEHGTAIGSGTYTDGTMVTIEAIPATGYYFTQWNDGVSRNPRSIMVTQDTSFTAFFAPNQYTLTVVAGEHGTATGSGTYNYGDTIIIQAFPEEHYHFTCWDDGVTENPRQYIVNGNRTLTAYFAIDVFTVNVATNNIVRGQVSSSGTLFEYGQPCSVTATAYTGYTFAGWSNGVTANPYTFAVISDVDLTALFVEDGEEVFTVTVESADPTMGNVSGGGQALSGGTVTISAIPREGYRFLTWNDGNTENPRTVTVTANITYTAYFESITQGISDIDGSSIIIYAADGRIVVRGAEGVEVRVFDVVGHEVIKLTCNSETPMLPRGVYLVKVGEMITKKIVVF